jgi:hypothetical protein
VHNGSLMAACHRRGWGGWLWVALLSMVAMARAQAQTCQSAADVDASVRTALETTAKRYFDMAARGDTAALQQNSIPAVAASFGGIEAAVKDNQSVFAGAQATVRPPFLLVADGNEPLARAEFLCGVFGKSGQTADSAVFVLNNLPPGKYGLAIVDVSRSQDGIALTLILQQMGADWKLAGFYTRSAQLNGHDGAWFAQRARDFKAKGQNRNAWLYYHEAISLAAPVDFMSTLVTDKLYDEMQPLLPADLPVEGNAVDLSAGGKVYKLTQVFPLAVGNDLDVVVKYQAADVSNTAETFKENTAVMKALIAKFPEFRDAFAGVVARAVEPSGRDYGSLLPMKEIK